MVKIIDVHLCEPVWPVCDHTALGIAPTMIVLDKDFEFYNYKDD